MPISGGASGKFWTQSPARDPKRGFRFRVEFGSSGPIWYAKKADKPQVSFSEASHNYLNHTFYWPARAEWNEVTVTLVDPVQPDLAGEVTEALELAGYRIPAGTLDTHFGSISKKSATDQFGGGAESESTDDIRIIQLDEDGNQLEVWTLKHAWLKEVTFGDLDYSSDDLLEVTMKFRYDWAEFRSGAPESTTGGIDRFAPK